MPSDYENGLKKIIDLSVQTEKMTSGILKSAVQEFLSGSAEKSGQMTLKQLERKSGGKLDSIEISESNIAAFGSKTQSDCLSNAAGSTRNESDFSFE